MIRYFTSWYAEKNEERRAELIHCITKCCESDSIDVVYLICEAPYPHTHPKLICVEAFTRYKYEDFFLLANTVSELNDIALVANTDIYIAPNMRLLLEQLQPQEAWCLSRWDEDRYGNTIHFNRPDSQDVFCMRAPTKNIEAPFISGTPGSDNALCVRLEQAGYVVSNPSKDIKTIHYHLTGLHNYNASKYTVPSPYLLIHPTHLGERVDKWFLSVQPTQENPINPSMYR
jgi:hypothetical protein